MIAWMKRHKKWLMIILWISTIAFVGAGFVGWGSYDYGKKGGVVASVGDREISSSELQTEYSNLYNQYKSAFGSNFNQEMADKLRLEDMALNQVIQRNLLLSYADDLGLAVTNEDIAKKLLEYKAFLKDGKFDKDTYVKVLNQNRTTVREFEDGLKRGILLAKVEKLFDVNPTNVEVENLTKLLFLEDSIEYKVISADDISVDVKDVDVKKYWEEHKDNYLSEVSYDLALTNTALIDSKASDADIKSYYEKFRLDYRKKDGKVKTLEEAKADIIKDLDKKASKKEALKKYLKIKKGEVKLETKESFTQSSLPFGTENNQKIEESKDATLLKPFFYDEKYVTVKVLKKKEAKPLSFEKAQESVKKDFIQLKKIEKLGKVAKEELKDFNGVKVDSLTRESLDKINNLSKEEASSFLNQLFSSKEKKGLVNLNTKMVLFKVLSSKLAVQNDDMKKSTKKILTQIENQNLMNNLMEKLQNTYEIKTLIQTKKGQ